MTRPNSAGAERRVWLTAARVKWPRALWIIGTGQYASVATCGGTTVILFQTPMEATQALR